MTNIQKGFPSGFDKAWDDLLVEREKNSQLQQRVSHLEELVSKYEKRLALAESGQLNGSTEIPSPRDSTSLNSSQSPWDKKFSISQNVLVVDDTGPNLQSLPELIKLQHGPAAMNPYSPHNDRDCLLSVSTAQSLANEVRQLRQKRRVSLSQAELLQSPLTSAAQQLVTLLRTEYAKDPSLKCLSEAQGYAGLCTAVASRAADALAKDPIFLSLKSPVYVMGDLHGNYHDLNFFLDHLVNFQHFAYTAGPLLFLGDYVDRGECSVEVAALLLALKCLSPDCVYLLRGNHELKDLNSGPWYGEMSFIRRCQSRFGEKLGMRIHAAFNQAFAKMPLAAEVDQKIFCVHGGIPRPEKDEDFNDCMTLLRDPQFPRREIFNLNQSQPAAEQRYVRLALGLLWSDPAPPNAVLDEKGFGPNDLRGGNAYVFGKHALETFCSQTGYEFIIRAHEVKQEGLRLSHNARVITVFTSSGYCGGANGAGAVCVKNRTLRLISVMQSVLLKAIDRQGSDVVESPNTNPVPILNVPKKFPRKMNSQEYTSQPETSDSAPQTAPTAPTDSTSSGSQRL